MRTRNGLVFSPKALILMPCNPKTRLDGEFGGTNSEWASVRPQNHDFETLQPQNTAG